TPFGIERQSHVRLFQIGLQALGLLEKVSLSRLEVEDQKRLYPPRRVQVAANDAVALTHSMHAVIARRLSCDGGDQLERGQHRSAGALIALCELHQTATRLSRGSDSEGAELGILRSAVKSDDVVCRKHHAAPTRELRLAISA